VGLWKGFVIFSAMSELEPAGESLWGASLSTPRHSTPEAVEAPATRSSTHLSTKHLHQDFGVDLHPTSHATSTEPFHRINKILTAIVACTFPTTVLVKEIRCWDK
jgi:hypothetical protein